MGSPPQGYTGNQLVLGNGWSITPFDSATISFKKGTTEVAQWSYDGTTNSLRMLDTALPITFIEQFVTTTGNLTIRAFDGTNILALGIANNRNLYIRPQIGQYDGVATLGKGLVPMYGLDNRSGLVAADGAPITLYAVPAGAGQLFRISADIFATVVSAGTANYTITWTENAQAKTMVVSASVVNTLATATDLINADPSTSITAQLTFAGFTGTVKVASVVEQLA